MRELVYNKAEKSWVSEELYVLWDYTKCLMMNVISLHKIQAKYKH